MTTNPDSPLQAFRDFVQSEVNPQRVAEGQAPLSPGELVRAFELSLEIDRAAILQMDGLVPA